MTVPDCQLAKGRASERLFRYIDGEPTRVFVNDSQTSPVTGDRRPDVDGISVVSRPDRYSATGVGPVDRTDSADIGDNSSKH